MAQVRVPSNVSSITLATSGALVPAGGIITCTADEATILQQGIFKGQESNGVIDSVPPPTNTVRLRFPSIVTSITINGNVIAIASGVSASIGADDAANFLRSAKGKAGQGYFQLVSG